MPEKSHSCTVALHFYLLVHVLHLGGWSVIYNLVSVRIVKIISVLLLGITIPCYKYQGCNYYLRPTDDHL